MQCGYDTPGLVMAVYALLVQKENVSIQEIIKHCDGVFSRCNGYRAVVEAVKSFTGNKYEPCITQIVKKLFESKFPRIINDFGILHLRFGDALFVDSIAAKAIM